MIVADASTVPSLETGDALAAVLDEFEVHTTETVVAEPAETADYDDRHADAAASALERRPRFSIHAVSDPIESSRIDAGEGSCAVLADDLDAAFLLTDDLRALPELQSATTARVAVSPLVLRALVERDVFTSADARERLETIADTRDWLGAPIYRRARRLFESLPE